MYKVFDLHNDYLLEIKKQKHKEKYITKSLNQGVKNICSAVWTTNMNKDTSFAKIIEARAFCDRHNLKLAIEDLHFVSSYEDIDKIIDIKPAYVTLTWNHENKLGGGAFSNTGLTSWGKKVIKQLENNNIQIDTAHMNENSFMDFLSITTRPLLCSHTAFFSLCNHPRNLKDYQIKIIEEYKGIIGLCFVKDFITKEKRCNINDLLNHITYFTNKFSIKCLCIGSDFYGTKNLPKGIKNYKSLNKIQSKLTTYGFSNNAIRKIYYKNADRFFKENI